MKLCYTKYVLNKLFAFFFPNLDQPEQPAEFRVVNITKSTITLTWKKSFDGGEAQKFRIRYRKDTMDPTYKYIETESVSYYFKKRY